MIELTKGEKVKTKEQVLIAVKNGDLKSGCLDYKSRLCNFFDVDDWKHFGFKVKENADVSRIKIKEWTYENIIEQMKSDVGFGFEKALNKRGISSDFMHSVVKMWLWALDCELKDHNEYAQYGLPLFKVVALKYEFDNPIGNDYGNEYKYSSESYYA